MDHGEQTSVIENLIYSPTMNSEGDVINLYHLQLQYEDAGNCLELIEKGQERPNYITQSGERLFDAFKTIQDFLQEQFPQIADLKKFVVFLLNKTSFIRIFETINQRGKGLDPMDLLKNMVFRQVDRSKFKELNMNWKSITRSLEKIDEKPLRFLHYFIMANYDTSSEKDGILREDQIYTGSAITTHSAIIKKLHFSLFKKWHKMLSYMLTAGCPMMHRKEMYI